MKILLFNDNPVVRKLVALSAQKTKDELFSVGSMEEIGESGYDLVIIDDGLYRDELFASLKEIVTFKATLLMATRGNALPSGFDHIINKPFLPTDLVDLFGRINKEVASKSVDLVQESPKSGYEAINLEESLLEFEPAAADGFGFDDLDALSDAFDLDTISTDLDELPDDFDMDSFSESLDLEGESEALSLIDDELSPAVLDHEEVQEVRDLLRDTEKDESVEDEKIVVQAIDELELPKKENSAEDEDNFDFDGFDFGEELEERVPNGAISDDEDAFDFEGFDFDEALGETESDGAVELLDDNALMNEMPLDTMKTDTLDELANDELFMDDDIFMKVTEESSEDGILSDEAFDNLELEIQDALGDLDMDDLDSELESSAFDFDDPSSIPSVSFEEVLEETRSEKSDSKNKKEEEALVDFGGLEGLDELDLLDERELKLAIGEMVADEPEIRIGGSEHASLNMEALDEALELSGGNLAELPKGVVNTHPEEGIEALEALLKALTNKEVVKSLKGLNISININFGNEK
ncbi:MAG: hypothetical protein M0P91_00695 [Sulfuricurvum sp.]|jgi:uncharacterized membrane protein|uniref:hypothetical protein n=1 Tax=Sulfuricurvum sp. TaxID=2025608 RepID=UPI0025DE5428|nr:hypothetical protein [Sulfuricurvum sp.]MCK9371687.1 hypothetical protein [Sulfuricurvum sp.]